MSRPPTFTPPPGTVALRLDSRRGEFAALETRPAGPPRATALLLPGFTGSKEDFLPLLPLLADGGYRVLAVDGRGQYETPGPEDPGAYAQQALAEDVLAQAAALGAGPVHLLGHSLGGHIARAAVLREPSAFRSLTVLSSGPAAVSNGQKDRLALLSQALRTMEKGAVWEAMQALESPEQMAGEHAPAVPVDDYLRERWMRTNTQQLLTTGHELTVEPDRVAPLAATGLPLHVVSGQTDDTWPVEWLDEMALRLGARRTVVEGAGHSPNTDRPRPTARALLSFWDRCPA
ncbi:alpha/beta fold hydrolase [Streptomyces sp. NPDC007088]|uniref:alpha/beta fold hydrolase n=1 Tax=Streptomyces sp. NPDC007088 TaxID=3364773 RepID=UPI00368DC8E4